MKGFRQEPQVGRKERIRELEAELTNIQMALRVSQMMTQQLMASNKALAEDMTRYAGSVNELQYKFLAVQKVAKLSTEDLNNAANELRLKDFNEASDLEDAEKGYTVGTTVEETSVVILTSSVEGDSSRGLFRSKVSVSETGPVVSAALIGKTVGDRVEAQLAGETHLIEILGVRSVPAPEAVSQ